MKFKIKIKPKISYHVSIAVFCVILFYFAYKGFVAYLIHKELYGSGLDTLVLLRASISGIIDYVDLDSHYNLDPDPSEGCSMVNGVTMINNKPGHGSKLKTENYA